MPHVSYWVNKEYIAAKLCENKDRPEMKCEGKCHLSKKVKEQQEQSSNGELPVKGRYVNVVHLPTALLPELKYTRARQTYFCGEDRLSERHAWAVFHPPKA